MVLRTKIESAEKPYDAFTAEGLAADASDASDTERKSDDEDDIPTYTKREVKERGGKILKDRFTINPKGRLKVGKAIYQALVKKMFT